jgi:CheY-like chemotaxis protein
LLAFSRKQILQPKVLSLNETVHNLEEMLHRLIGEDVELAVSLDPSAGQVKADPGQLEQVIMNLVVNARDAMPAGGKLTIETANVQLDEEYAQQHAEAQPGFYVMLAVNDTGEGMDEETQAQVFEPFFTTKEVGKGTGLGLSTVYGIVKQSGGSICVYSEQGKGTSFKIYLPRVEENVVDSESKRPPADIPRGSETVLVVEDEASVRDLLQELLNKCGYNVLTAKHGDEALTVCEHHQGPIHLLITDMVMPKMNGRQLAEELTNRHPETRVLYISGYTDEFVVQRGELESDMDFLQKPFSVQSLTTKVREVLDAPVCVKR